MMHGIRLLVGLLALAISSSLACGQSPRVDRAEVIEVGVYTATLAKTIDDKSISTGTRSLANKVQITENTTLIRAVPGMIFGLDFETIGAPKGTTIPVKIVWRYPQPGLQNPSGGDSKLIDEYMDTVVIGKTQKFFWSLGQQWQIVPGVWTFELWYSDRNLISQNFTMVKG